jgi:hypothetical protein
MSSTFTAFDVTRCERMMGRRSRIPARRFIVFAGLRDCEGSFAASARACGARLP